MAATQSAQADLARFQRRIHSLRPERGFPRIHFAGKPAGRETRPRRPQTRDGRGSFAPGRRSPADIDPIRYDIPPRYSGCRMDARAPSPSGSTRHASAAGRDETTRRSWPST